MSPRAKYEGPPEALESTFGVLESSCEAVRALLNEADATAKAWTRDRTDLTARLADLDGLVTDLEAARAPLTKHVKSLPQGSARRSDPVAALDAEATTALRRLRALRRRSGPHSAAPRRTAPIVTRKKLDGTLHQAKQALNEAAADFESVLPTLERQDLLWRGGGRLRDTAVDARADARTLIRDVEAARDRVNVAWRRYELDQPAREATADNPHAERDDYEATAEKVAAVRQFAKAQRAKIVAAINAKPAPKHEPYERWTHDDALASWLRFHQRHGRWPTKREHGQDGLPHYTQLARAVGPRPLATMREAASHQLQLVAPATN